MEGRLNLFQASMLRWRELHPYNAVHVLAVDDALDLPRLKRAIVTTLETTGLTGLDLDARRLRYTWSGGAAQVKIRVVPAAATPGADDADADHVAAIVDREIERELNAPFPPTGALDPFRFFVVDRAADFALGLAYDHFIAAGDVIVALLKAIVECYRGDQEAAHASAAAPTVGMAATAGQPAMPMPMPAFDRYPPTYRRLFQRQWRPTLAGLRRVPAIVAGFRHAFRPRYPHGDAPGNAFVHRALPAADLAQLQRVARAWQVTLNDLVLALLLETLAPLTEARHGEPRRRELAVASIVNIRADCGPSAAGAFGQFLSSFLVAHAVPPGITLDALARDIAVSTGRIKREKLYLQTLLAMGASGHFWRWLSPRQRARFHGKAYPVWAGTSSLNVDALWNAAAGTTPLGGYVRAIPTGPLAPMVVAATTAAGTLVLGVSYRPAAFGSEEIAKMLETIQARIATLA